MSSIPVILDTDIGDDIDDVWALIMLLRCPELDVRLVTTTSSHPEIRARYVARILEIAGRTDIPIGIGVPIPNEVPNPNATIKNAWVHDYSLKNYPGTVHEDGPGAAISTIQSSTDQVSVIAIGPLSTLGEVLRREPGITRNSRFIGMHGSIYRGYNGSPEPCSETNVRLSNPECKRVFQSDWAKTITPLDTCGIIKLDGERYERIRHSSDPLVRALMDLNDLFGRKVPWMTYDPTQASSILFDTVAVYLAYSEELVDMTTLPLSIEEGGFTRIDKAAGAPVRCALSWKDLEAFHEHLTGRILGV